MLSFCTKTSCLSSHQQWCPPTPPRPTPCSPRSHSTHPQSVIGPCRSPILRYTARHGTTERCSPRTAHPRAGRCVGLDTTPRPGYLPPAGRAAGSSATAAGSCCEPCLGAAQSRPSTQACGATAATSSRSARPRRSQAFESPPLLPSNVRGCAPLSFRTKSPAVREPTMHCHFRPQRPRPLLSEVRGEERARRRRRELRPRRREGRFPLAPPRPAEIPARSSDSSAHAQSPCGPGGPQLSSSPV